MKKKEFLSAGEAAHALGVSVKTIQRWDKAGLLPVIRTATNQRRIPVDAVERIRKTSGQTLRCAIYARVSSAKQELMGNLTHQVERNERRRGMKRLFQLIDQQEIDVILIEYPDRLVRFGFGHLEEAFRWKQVRLEAVEPPGAPTPTEELVADLLSIVTVFSGRLYGSRAKKVRHCVSQALKDCVKAEAADGTDHENDQTPA